MSMPKLNTLSGTDLPDLAELPQPSAVSLFPETLAWKLLLVGIILLLLAVAFYQYRKYQRRLWRRQAQALSLAAGQSASVDQWFVLIKRVSHRHMTAEQLNALTEKALLAQLPDLPLTVQAAMEKQHYQPGGTLSEIDNRSMMEAFSRWLKELPDV